ncbi:hypothetical protein [Rhodopirellula europaea]|uniref:hypothetical protein n=1 Tax=Rhodopirellula europaea TaxID=1263866 RepID=UPI0005607538|nr:hypothetical protein [Rhodopirellula europaea]
MNFASVNRVSIVAIIVCAVPLLAASVYFVFWEKQAAPVERSESSANLRDQKIVLGGVPRPLSDVSKRSDRADLPGITVDPAVRLVFGSVPIHSPDKNKTIASVHEAMVSEGLEQQLSPLKQPVAFDRKSYESNREEYLSLHEPGRAFQSAQPGPGVPVLKSPGQSDHVLRQGESVRLQAQTEPQMPVTFTSFDIGLFENGLTSITVAADGSGIAEASYLAAPGKIGEVNILAASPVAAEQVKYQIWILPPEKP